MFTYSAGGYYMVIKINMVYQRIGFFIERKCSKNEVVNIIIKKMVSRQRIERSLTETGHR